jgi:hypothetical protein
LICLNGYKTQSIIAASNMAETVDSAAINKRNDFNCFFGSLLISGDKLYLKKNKIIEKGLLEKVFPTELVEYFEITNYQELCSIQDKLEYIIVTFKERNELPNGYSFDEYETKDFMSSKLIQDFPIRGKGVYLRIIKRRWRHKQT